jgi:hypothetical protein
LCSVVWVFVSELFGGWEVWVVVGAAELEGVGEGDCSLGLKEGKLEKEGQVSQDRKA